MKIAMDLEESFDRISGLNEVDGVPVEAGVSKLLK